MLYYHFKDINRRLRIGKIICLARTYRKHAEEMNSKVTEKPLLFLKPASSVIFDGQTIIIPRQSKIVHHEVELGVVIGRRAKNIEKKDVMSHILGYLLGLDITARDIQEEAKRNGWPWTISKSFDTFCPISKVVLKEEVDDPYNLDLILKVNNEIRQSSNTRYLIYSIEEIIEFISSIMTLKAGDLILTGTPEGVSQIRDGDIVEAKLGDICSLKLNVTLSG
ncbi:MAG: acylpyruvase [Thermoplasmata archaeon]|nr:MAG: acylpyruvase [Thermoplasmata archaeon]